MKKIINGKKYDTDTAKAIGFDTNCASDFHYWYESLYIKKTGEYFLYGKGGPMSRYCEYIGDCQTSGEKIIPMTVEEAKEWAEKHLTADEYEEIFGEVEE